MRRGGEGRPVPDENPEPSEIRKLLEEAGTIAVIGLSNKPHRDSYMVGRYLKDHGYKIIPVSPNIEEWEGIRAYKVLADVPEPVDIVDVFRKPEAIPDMTDEIIAKKPRAVWFQLGIVNNEAAGRMRREGIMVIQDRCLKIEHMTRLGG